MIHLCIPDPHAHPDHNNERFNVLGKLVADIKPDKVICLGDWACMPSLSSYDKGTKGFEGRRYTHDINASDDANERFFYEIKKTKKKLPEFHMLVGNHEYRIERAVNASAAQLDGVISLNDLKYRDFGWDVTDYHGSTPGIKEIDGVSYAHYFTSGIMSRPIGGLHPAYQLLHKQYMSTTQGHTHTTDFCVRTNARGWNIMGLVAGCYIDYFAAWAGEANNLWWSGVIVKRNVERGQYDPQWISMDALKKEYS